MQDEPGGTIRLSKRAILSLSNLSIFLQKLQ